MILKCHTHLKTLIKVHTVVDLVHFSQWWTSLDRSIYCQWYLHWMMHLEWL